MDEKLSEKIRRGDLNTIMGYLHEFQQMLHEAEIEVPFPKIVICGEENFDISSIVERFAMLRFYPRRNGISTRMPISLKLHQTPEDQLRKKFSYLKAANRLGNTDKEFSPDFSIVQLSFSAENLPQSMSFSLGPLDNPEEIQNYISECQVNVLNQVGNVSSIVEKFLEINIWRLHTIDLEFFVLPGVAVHEKQGEKPEMAARSSAITKHYLSETNTIPVVVVPDKLSSLDKNSVIEMVKELKRTENAIGILSKSDLSYQDEDQNPFARLVKLAAGTASDIPEGMQFVAVKNRENVDQHQLSLQYDAEIEVEWFKNHVPGLLEMNLATIDVAMERITEKLRNYLLGWLATIKRNLKKSKIKNEKQLQDLGEENPNLKDLCRHLQELVPNMIGDYPDIFSLNTEEIKFEPARLFDNEANLKKIWEKLNFDKFVKYFLDQFSKTTSLMDKSPLKLHHFKAFCQKAKMKILELLLAYIKEIKIKYFVDYQMLISTWRWKFGGRTIQSIDFENMRTDLLRLHQYYVTELMYKMKQVRIENLEFDPEDIIESEVCTERRQRIREKLQALKKCYSMLSGN